MSPKNLFLESGIANQLVARLDDLFIVSWISQGGLHSEKQCTLATFPGIANLAVVPLDDLCFVIWISQGDLQWRFSTQKNSVCRAMPPKLLFLELLIWR